MAIQPQLIAIPAPPPPVDLIQSALFLPLSAISQILHRGKKIRTIGQVIDYDPKSSLLLLSSNVTSPTARRQTILANTSVPLVGTSPAVRDVYESPVDGGVQRPKLKFEKGEWLCVVGWLEGIPPKRIIRDDSGGPYLPPLPLVLDLIHISPAREPPLDAVFRGQVQ